jgi:hypothetical protein
LGYSSSDNLLSFGYGGTIVLAIRLEERGSPVVMRTAANSTSTRPVNIFAYILCVPLITQQLAAGPA